MGMGVVVPAVPAFGCNIRSRTRCRCQSARYTGMSAQSEVGASA